MTCNIPQRGFTLIELSIVIVIIALVAGGVLVGRDLISASMMRAQISQIDQFNSAINTFRSKYNCLPGDCAGAVGFGLGVSGGDCDNGNGNGRIDIDDVLVSFANGKERFNLWCHLSNSGLLAESYTGLSAAAPVALFPLDNTKFPAAKLEGGAYVLAGTWNNNQISMYFGSGFWLVGTTATSFNTNILTALTAKQLDSKIDDGIPNTGTVVTTRFLGAAVGQEIQLTVDWNDGCYAGLTPIGVYDIAGLRRDGGADAPPYPDRPDCSLLIRAGGW